MKTKVIVKKKRIGLNPLRQRRISRSCAMGDGCETKMRMLRTNNRDLARALSDQKMEANHWYSEAITLKGELQELQEKQLRMPTTNMYVESVFVEAEKQIKECYESMDKDFNSALDRIVQAVERLTKIKQLVGGIQSMLQTSSQAPSSIFSRTPGSRIPLRSNGSSPSPRQRAVPPMVGGHVLQPVMVPLPKLKIDWNDRTRNHFSVQGENGFNMSTIGEQSSRENSVVDEEQQSSDVEEELQPQNDGMATPDDAMLGSQSPAQLDVTDLQARLGEDTARRYTLRGKTEPSPEPQVPSPLDSKVCSRRKIQSRRGKERKSGRRSSTSKSSSAEASEHLTLSLEGKAAQTCTGNSDPLEGPSWLLDKSPPQANRTRFCRRRVRVCKKKRANVVDELSSSDEEADEKKDLSPGFKRNTFEESMPRKKAASPAITIKDSPSLSLDQSCLDSPTSMLARLETLEAAGGRKSKRFLKRRKYFGDSQTIDVDDEDSSSCLQQDKQLDMNTMPSTKKTANKVSSPRKMDAGVESVTENNKGGDCNTSSALITVTPELPSEDNNTTCKIVTNMDITLPVSNPIIEETPTTFTKKDVQRLQDECNPAQSKKKFFKTRDMEVVEEITESVEKTPFDISMLNESVIKMPPFSSTRTTEKENLPPLSVNISETVSLCDVSVVLEDVMKQSLHSKTPKELHSSTQKVSQSAKSMTSNTPRKLRSVTRRTLQYTINYNEDSDDIRKPNTERKPKKKEEKKHSLKTEDVLVDSTPTPDMESLAKSDTKLLDDIPEDTGIEPKETRGKEDCVVLSDNIEEIKHLNECFVVIQRTPITGSFTTRLDKNSPRGKIILSDLSVLPDVNQQQQQPFEDGKNPQGQGPQMETSNVGSDTPSNSCNTSPVNTETNTSISKDAYYSRRAKKAPRRLLSHANYLSQNSGESDTADDGNSDNLDDDPDFVPSNTFDCVGNKNKHEEDTEAGTVGNRNEHKENTEAGIVGNKNEHKENTEAGIVGNKNEPEGNTEAGIVGNKNEHEETTETGIVGNKNEHEENTEAGIVGNINEHEGNTETGIVGNKNEHVNAEAGTVGNKNEHEDNIEARTETSEPEDDRIFVDKEDPCVKKQIQQDKRTQQDQDDTEKHDVATNPDRGVAVFESFEGLQTQGNSERTTVALKPLTVDLDVECLGTATETGTESSKSKARLNRNEESAKDNNELQKSSEGTSNGEEPPSVDCGRKRRAALKISSFKEASLNRKMRRGEDDAVIIHDPEKKGRGSGRPRGKPRGKSKGRGKSSMGIVKTIEAETSE